MAAPCPAMLRGTAGEVLKGTLYLICDEQKEWATFFYFTPPRPTGTPPIFPNGNTRGEGYASLCSHYRKYYPFSPCYVP